MISSLLPVGIGGHLSHRDPHLDATRVLKPLGHDADDGVGLAVESQRLVHNARLPAETTLPKIMAQNCDRRAARFVFFVRIEPADGGVYAQRGKEIRGSLDSEDALGFSRSGEVVTISVV